MLAPAPAQDPIVQHLKLTDAQVSKIKTLHQQLEKNVQAISMKDVKDGMIIDMIQSGKWNEAGVKQQLAAFSKVDQQVRYYKVKYYFDLSQVLTADQRKQHEKNRDDVRRLRAAGNGCGECGQRPGSSERKNRLSEQSNPVRSGKEHGKS